ncbi:MAG: glycoside hydrolase family 3 protein [bacterium]|nr:glycoside hydrolase family 3 protein [bacterium]
MQIAQKNLIAVLILIILLIFSYFALNFNENKITDDKLDDKLKEKIGQMLIIGFRGTEVNKNSNIIKAIKNLNLGGVILFDYDVPSKSRPRNITSPEQTKKLIQNLKTLTNNSPFVAIDAEGGFINRLKPNLGFSEIPSAQEMGKKTSEETKQISETLSKQLADLGFNLNFAPVVDVNVNPENPVIGGLERSFSADPEIVSEQAMAFIEGQRANKILTAIKHFPGHGSSQNDSHLGMVDTTNTYKQEELIPYKNLIKNNSVDMVMTAHIINKNIDPDYPATLSPLFLQNILRNELKFEGVIISDDMQMGAITEHYGFEDALIRAINAGCNLLIISNNGAKYDEQAPYDAIEIIFKAVKSGKISQEKIDKSLEKINLLKNK